VIRESARGLLSRGAGRTNTDTVDRDAELTRAALAWAEEQGLQEKVAPELLVRQGLTDEEVDALIAERNTARKQRNFRRSFVVGRSFHVREHRIQQLVNHSTKQE